MGIEKKLAWSLVAATMCSASASCIEGRFFQDTILDSEPKLGSIETNVSLGQLQQNKTIEWLDVLKGWYKSGTVLLGLL